MVDCFGARILQLNQFFSAEQLRTSQRWLACTTDMILGTMLGGVLRHRHPTRPLMSIRLCSILTHDQLKV